MFLQKTAKQNLSKSLNSPNPSFSFVSILIYKLI
jgi:hypothetical protein